MKLRTGHIIIAIAALLGVFVVFAAVYTGARPYPDLETAAESAYLLPPQETPETTTSLPPADAGPEKAPRIEAETDVLDLGVIPNDAFGRKDLLIYNRGDAPLLITNIQSSCACVVTRTSEAKPVVPPGASAAVEVGVNPFRVPGFYSRKTLTIFSNDYNNSQIEVDVTARITPEFALEPEELDFGVVEKGAMPEKTVLLRQVREEPVTVTAVSPVIGRADEEEKADSDLILSLAPVPEAEWKQAGKAEYAIRVQLAPALPPGEFLRPFRIETNVERIAKIGHYRYPVSGTIEAFYTVKPAWPRWVSLKQEENAPDKISGTAEITADRPISVSDIEAGPALSVSARKDPAEDNTVRLDIVAAPGAAGGRIREEIHFNVESGGKTYPERIAVRGLLLKQKPS
jgi:hypothetical protein